MARRGNDRAPAVIRRLTEIGAAVLVRDLGMDPQRATATMREIAHDLAKEYGGQNVYIGRDLEFDLTKRDMEIYRAHNGRNVPELALRYKLSEVQIYNILAHVRRQMMRKQQPRLPGFEDAA